MGELFPFIVVIAAVLVIVTFLYARKSMNLKQVLLPIEQMDRVERVKIPLDSVRAQVLAKKLEEAGAESWDSRKTVIVDYNDSDDRIIRFIVEPKKPEKKA